MAREGCNYSWSGQITIKALTRTTNIAGGLMVYNTELSTNIDIKNETPVLYIYLGNILTKQIRYFKDGKL